MENKEIVIWLKNELNDTLENRDAYNIGESMYIWFDSKAHTIQEVLRKLGVLVEVSFKQTSEN
jgi:hypothetical protein